MNTKKIFDKASKKIILKSILIIFFITAFSVVLGILGAFSKLDFRFYDFLIKLRPNAEAREEIVFIDIDDYSIDKLGAWPWTRDIYANTLIRMKELGAKVAVFDVEFLSPSNSFVNPNLENILQNSFEKKDSFSSSKEYSEKLKDVVLLNYDEYFSQSIQFFGNTWLTINNESLADYSAYDLDYVNSRFLLNVEDSENLIFKGNIQTYFEQTDKSIFEKLALDNIDFSSDLSSQEFLADAYKYSPAMNLFISKAKGAGFTNSFIDSDGSRRRVELLSRKGDKYVGQLVFAPILNFFAPEKIIRTKNTLELINANVPQNKFSETKICNISIPLDEKGRMLVNWQHSDFMDSFKHDSVCLITQLDDIEKNIYSILIQIDEIDFLGANNLAYKQKIQSFISAYQEILEYKNYLLSISLGFDIDGNAIQGGIDKSSYDEYFTLRKEFFKELTSFSENYEANELEELENHLLNLIEILGAETISEYGTWFEEAFDVLKSECSLYNSTFNTQFEKLNNSFCLVGNTACGTTDLGTTPFYRLYPNVGLHANVYNTILTQNFITPVNWGYGIAISVLLTFILIGCIPTKKAFVQILLGVILLAIVVLIPIVLIVAKSIYLPSVTSIFISSVSFLCVTALRFISSEKDKKFLQNTFGAYVAPAVVDEIIKNPNYASLGGKSDELTALFSDVKTFSGFTEVINNEELKKVREENEKLPKNEQKSEDEVNLEGAAKGAERLVAVLNEYLGVLSDAIMAEGGTIDKYVGDEIVSFFGAPVHDVNNAFNACVAGIRMLQAESKYNDTHKDLLPINPQTGEPFYLRSRVGLNTGNMVVGNMGTEKKLNYTIMGNNVNLASRLEGTNKAYGSWIMVSESTWLSANKGENKGKLVARLFDAVRVINVKKPVRIVNIIGLREELTEDRIKATEFFNEGMKWYMKGSDTPEMPKDLDDFKKAYVYYKKANELYPNDESSQVFMSRCADFMKNGIRGDWDGVYTMTSK